MTHKRRNFIMAAGFGAALWFSCMGPALAGTVRDARDPAPTGKGWGELQSNSSSTTITGNGINYHGGPIMAGTPNVYFIWYGNWNSSTGSNSATTMSLLSGLFSSGGLNLSGYEAIDSTYYQVINSVTTAVTGGVVLAASTTDSYSQGKRISDSQVQAIVSRALNNGSLGTADPNGIYFVLTSSDVSERSGFCTRYCGWHTHASINGVDIKYSFVGNPDRCPSACEWQTTSPNNDSGADGMASVMAHESEEMISDPDLNAWYDSSGAENADKCAWKFGPTSTASNGSVWNETLNGKNWLIQMNWENLYSNNQAGGCAQTYGGPFYTN